MIVCRKCSRRHADGTDFCACGAFLEFDGEHIADEIGPAVTPAAGGTATPAGPAAAAPTDAWGSTAPATPPAPPPTSSSHARHVDEPAPWSGFSPAPATSSGASGGVQAQLPDAPIAPAASEPVDVRPTMRPGDVACSRCATPNPPSRQFCQHCGHELGAPAAITANAAGASRTPSRWRKVRAVLRRRGISTDPSRLATQAHMLSRGGMSGRTTLFRTGGIALVLASMLAFLGPWRPTVTAWARDRLGASRFEVIDVEPEQIESVPADPSVASAVFPLQEADRAVDRHLNTSWATRWIDPVGRGVEAPPDDDACQDVERTDTFLRVTFADPTDLARFSVIPGRYDGDENRGTFFRPSVLELRWNDAEDGRCRYVALADGGELSQHAFEHDDVSVIEIRVVGVFADNESTPSVDISEIVFERGR
jgi:hypothetical protein